MNSWPKRCGCGREICEGEWSDLPLVGYVDVPEDEEGPAERIELRNCSCTSTIAIEVPVAGPSKLLLFDLSDLFRVEAARTRGDLTEWQAGQFWRGSEVRLDLNHYLPEQDEGEAARLEEIADELESRAREVTKEDA